ncbi:MAG: hypothetical protein IID03_12755 [Candidatus Dadabacteria bacterium]|nr:hypothetical protein [Candidatus Dadabacteria bacterium]
MFAEDTGLYFYSAWLQADAAIFALVFIFIIYKLQSIENTYNSISAMIHNDKGKSLTLDFLDTMKNKNARVRFIEQMPNQSWRDLLESLGKAYDDKLEIPKLYKPLFKMLPLVLLLSSILLLLSNVLHNQGVLIELTGFSLLLLVQISLISKMIKIISDMLLK